MGLIFLIALWIIGVKSAEKQGREITQERLDKFKRELSEERKKFWDYYNETGRIYIPEWKLNGE